MSETLERAFRSFERAAEDLRDGQYRLHDRVRLLEGELLDANRRLEAVLDAVDSGIAVVSSNGTVLRTNRAFDSLQLVEQHGPNGDGPDPMLLGMDDEHAVTRLRHPVGDGTRDLIATCVPVGDEDGTRVLTVKDTTDVRREEVEGGRRRRLEAMGRMAAELAHEVRNPLGAIRLFATMLRDDLEGRPQPLEMTDRILHCVAGLDATITNLLSFSSPCAQQLRTVDFAAATREACELLASACSIRGVRLELPQDNVRCDVVADPEGLRQIVLNLVGNALAATRETGEIQVSLHTEDDCRVLTVADDGCGISQEDLPRVFDPFFTRSEGGTGLGLSIVHGIVERHGGTVTLQSSMRSGTVARVQLPIGHGGRHA